MTSLLVLNPNLSKSRTTLNFSHKYYSSTSTKGVKRLTKKEREKICLTDKEKEVLVGLLLGDAHIQQRLSTGNSRLRYAQTVKHDAYFYHVFDLFKKYCTVDFNVIEGSHLNSTTKMSYKSLTFLTISLPCFNEYRNIFYLNNTKIVPKNIKDLLTPVGLAYWIMDDGSKIKNGLHLNTYGFTLEEVELLVKVLMNKFGLKCSIHMKDNQPRIYINYESINTLKSLVVSHMHFSMLYKLNLE